jgi:hypothetical protein
MTNIAEYQPQGHLSCQGVAVSWRIEMTIEEQNQCRQEKFHNLFVNITK